MPLGKRNRSVALHAHGPLAGFARLGFGLDCLRLGGSGLRRFGGLGCFRCCLHRTTAGHEANLDFAADGHGVALQRRQRRRMPATPKQLTADLQGLSLPSFNRGGSSRVHGRSAQQTRAPRPIRRTPCDRPRTPRGRSRRAGRARTHPPLPGRHNPHGVPPRRLASGLARTPRRARAPTARAPHPIPLPGVGGLRAQLSTPPACCARVVPSPPGASTRKRQQCKVSEASSPPNPPALNDDGLPLAPMTWAEPCDGQVQRVFLIDITTCPDCGGRLRWNAGGRLRMSLSPR